MNYLDLSKSVQYLGIFVDENLNWNNHIRYLSKQIALRTGIFYRLKSYVNENTSRMLYYSLIYSRLQYGIVAWIRGYNTE